MYFRSSDISDNKAYWNKFPSRFDPYVQWFKRSRSVAMQNTFATGTLERWPQKLEVNRAILAFIYV